MSIAALVPVTYCVQPTYGASGCCASGKIASGITARMVQLVRGDLLVSESFASGASALDRDASPGLEITHWLVHCT